MSRPRSTRPTFALVKRGDWYYVQFWADGRSCRVSARSSDLAKAELFLTRFTTDFNLANWLVTNRPPRAERRVRNNIPPFRHMLETVTLLSEKQITSQADLVPDMSGVYFLIKDGKIVYVGQARNVLSRIGEHIDTKDFDEWTWIAVTLDRLNITELAYIRHFNPPLNNDPESKARKRRLAEKTDNASL